MMELFHTVSAICSRATAKTYSTSFNAAIKLLHPDLRQSIFNIYGFVRFADEIVDSFHGFDKPALLQQFRNETYVAIERKISLNPILHSFQRTVHDYNIDLHLIDSFFQSMEMDLCTTSHDHKTYNEYIYGSAEVVGLMCLIVFCEGDKQQFEKLKAPAKSLGAAFQKVNFLRDIKADYNGLSRMYFPGCDFNHFTLADKKNIETDIEKDFHDAYKGILQLPAKARFGVYVAYKYYLSLFKKIKKLEPAIILEKRIRIPSYHKAMILMSAGMKNKFRILSS